MFPKLARSQIKDLKPVKKFLESKALRSENTSRSYLTGLVHFNNFLAQSEHTLETVLAFLLDHTIDVYELLQDFMKYQVLQNFNNKTARFNYRVILSYFDYHDIDFNPRRLKNKVAIPRLIKEQEQPIDAQDIRKLLLKCTNRRLRTYLLVLASGGMRAVEALAMRVKDVDFTSRPTRIHIRGEYSKTKSARNIFISDEAAQALKDHCKNYRKPRPLNDLIFQTWRIDEKANPRTMYNHVDYEFGKLLRIAGFDDKKDNSIRHIITLNSFRRFVDTTISNTVGKDYAEWFLGHANSPYYTAKPQERAEIYSKCMKHLTFLDYTVLEAMGKSTEADLEIKSKEIAALQQQLAQSKQEIKDQFQAYEAKMNEFVHDIQGRLNQEEVSRPYHNSMLDKMREILDRTAPGWFDEVYGPGARRLTPKAKEKIEEMDKIITPLIDAENRQRDLELQRRRKSLVKTLDSKAS
jgi:integrase